MKFILRFIFEIAANVVALTAAAHFVPGFHVTPTVKGYLVTAFLLAAAHLIIRPILKFVLAPVIILTFGIFIIVLNAALLFLVDKFSPALTIEGLTSLLLGTLIVSLVSGILHLFAHPFSKR